ncbi:hypothetical protein BJ875DRAFT_547988 [Amylocarpus encephaloides]|uniref:Uncharacterized protein n=1 Tax=Amylocarpus encephaloides TaxID=45428 RepID=A0A9P7Y6F5_9HELO|nr:hypothetical protein BJ875DRAFT_547988 [Amylocarpus encephaloides]
MRTSNALCALGLSVAVLAAENGSCSTNVEMDLDDIYCPGSLWNSVCCVEGVWAGPVITSFISEYRSLYRPAESLYTSIASRIASEYNIPNDIRTAADARASFIRSGVDSEFARLTVRTALPRAAVTTTIADGLICNGLVAVTVTAKDASSIMASATSAASGIFTPPASAAVMIVSGNTLLASAVSEMGSPESGTVAPTTVPVAAVPTAGAAVITQAPYLAVGGAALAFAYGVM